ncbi:hypothetical protein PLESTF_001581500 [Pleodorina starrii]|nr:hypothetical protein PLESTM_001213000 [Pleodorina starrii]GLC74993.1 hypothetical protein PLESTF_001581500 [Pleodorina starrii]
MSLMANVEAFVGALTELHGLCQTLKKYEQSFSAEAKQLFQNTSAAADHAVKELEFLPPPFETSIAGYLVTGNQALRLRAVLQSVQQALSSFASGTYPVPRSSKEELSRVHGLIISVKFALSSEQQLLVTQLRKLCAEVESRKHDFDVIETNLDNTMRKVLQQVHGQSVLEPEVLDVEVKQLQNSITEARAAKATQLEDILSLALNSLQRLHAGHADDHPESDDEAEAAEAGAGEMDGEDDEDDPFFMPMPGAIKWAEASKFKELAKPLAPEQPAERQFMIVMEDDDTSNSQSHTPSSTTAISAEPSANTLVGTAPSGAKQLPLDDSADSSPVALAAGAAATAAATAALAAVSSVTTEPAAEEADASPDSPVSLAVAAVSDTPRSTAGTESLPSARTEGPVATADREAVDSVAVIELPAPAEAGDTPTLGSPVAASEPASAAAAAAQAPAPPQEQQTKEKAQAPRPVPAEEKKALVAKDATKATDGTVAAGTAPAAAETPTPEKLTDFVNFLNGENPGACMFHAQMRLSPEGCMKLANFLRSSARVRALSLSHNYLGDAGLRLICEGLRENKSVTALDLPDNHITDVGAAILADAIKDNPSLTQLQLAYNKIGDQGAKALAQVIRTSHSLKKLGLAFNNIGKAGCQALTSAISSNQSLKHMQLLPGNPVEEKDAKALAKALKRNNKFSIKQLLGLKSDS